MTDRNALPRRHHPLARFSASSRHHPTRDSRRGAVAVEFALVSPLFVTILLGTAEVSRLFDVRNQMAIAAREGARLAATDREGLLRGGQSTNQKIEQDIRNYLDANGLSGDDFDIFIVNARDRKTPFDLDDAANGGRLFELRIEFPYGGSGSEFALSVKVVFRNARATIIR